ncbi:MAG TPA: zincin-like metallopeptidase domain-containing protein, partial [Allosphingosinicella sp.]|nr:zincin-like metallopeptidase domain-containing protein [Allosphingosinicella sp.]
MKKSLLFLLMPLGACAGVAPPAVQTPPTLVPARLSAWSPAQVQAILERTQTTRLAPDISHLSAGEREAVAKLIEVGRIFQDVYEDQRHRQALAARAAFAKANDPHSRDLATLYRLFQGPIATTLENKREPFLAVDEAPPGKNVYPWDLTREELDAYLAAHPGERAALNDLRSVVRRADAASLQRDLATLSRYPVLDTLHPWLRQKLEQLAQAPERATLYALPYSVNWPGEMIRAHGLLNEAADAVEGDDAEFARYLRNRSRDLLSDDYESGDAAWITGRFKNLNAQIGSYETYDDELLGTRAFYALNVLAARREEGAALRKALEGMQAVENALPYDRHKKVREEIPVGVYDVIADFGQSRGGNTATILPNEAYLANRYGRTILLRANIMRAPEIFGAAGSNWAAAVAPEFVPHLTADSNFNRTLWHEVGHYLGVDRTRDGRNLDEALGSDANLIEEMKADLVSLFAGQELQRRGYFTADQLRSHYASGILRTLQNNKPRRDQAYNTMQLMQWNWFLDKGVLRYDPATEKLSIDYGRYHQAVEGLLREVLAIQDAGDKARADAFINRWATWDENLHGKVAENIRAQQRYRYRLFTYAAL